MKSCLKMHKNKALIYSQIRFIVNLFILLLSLFKLSVVYAVENKLNGLNTEIKYIVLSIDGGGVRGIIPARILQEIENKTGKPIHQLVDMVAGNSTGGIIALGLVSPDKYGNGAIYSAKDLTNLYLQRSKEIFTSSKWWSVKTGLGLWGAKYDRDYLDKLLEEKFANATLSNTLKPVTIVSYSLDRGVPHVWTTRNAKENPTYDFFLKDIAGATSAAPTYFIPKELKNSEGKICYAAADIASKISSCYESDGGIFANNPSLVALTEAFRAIPTLKRDEILLISLGTGKPKLNKPIEELKNSGILGWVLNANLIDVMMNASSDLTEWESSVLGLNFVRIQVDLADNLAEMDNTSENNINALLQIAEKYIADNKDLIDKLCKKLMSRSQSVSEP